MAEVTAENTVKIIESQRELLNQYEEENKFLKLIIKNWGNEEEKEEVDEVEFTGLTINGITFNSFREMVDHIYKNVLILNGYKFDLARCEKKLKAESERNESLWKECKELKEENTILKHILLDTEKENEQLKAKGEENENAQRM